MIFFWLCDISFMCFPFFLYLFSFILFSLSFFLYLFLFFIRFPFIRFPLSVLGVWGFTPISTAGAYLGDRTPSEKMVYI